MTMTNETFTAQKNRRKRFRVVIQLLILISVAVYCVSALSTLRSYEAVTSKTAAVEDRGFVALSYFGVERKGNQNLIGEDRLRQHLKALKDLGYVTITQQDVIDYYQAKKNLPEKSLLLIFEDGRRDTAIFAQKTLEELNYKATMLTYPEKFDNKDPKFLMPDELKDLEKTTFWEMGSNGYRLSFINVYDRYGSYLGELDPLKHSNVAPYLSRRYNHYLMDYIRDEYGVPLESYNMMKDRIGYDYKTLRDSYSQTLGYVPGMYILMHSNTGSFGNNDRVSAVNDYWIKSLFKMNFNREGFCFNQRNSSIYDLTRMQPQAYWHTNHLLMRIKYDINRELEFIKGDLQRHKAWDNLKGALEVQDEKLILTSLAKDRGLLRLKNSNDFEDLKLSVRLTGNKLGMQKIYLRADDELKQFITVSISDNVLSVREKNGVTERELFYLDLDRHDGKQVLSIPEDKKAAEIRALETFIKYADSAEKAKLYAKRLKDKSLEHAPSVAEGAPPYKPEISIHAKGDRKLELSMKGNKLSINIDAKPAVADLSLSLTRPGSIYLESAWGGYGWSQRNLADDVYDGVFEQLVITENTGMEKEKVLYDCRLQGWEGYIFKARQIWDKIIDWFVTNL